MTDHDEIIRLRARVDDLDTRIDQMRQEAQEREIKRLRWGVSTLGTIVLVIGAWGWSQVQDLVSLKVGK